MAFDPYSLTPISGPLGGLRSLGASYQPNPLAEPPLTPEEEQSLINSLLGASMGGLEAVGYALDTPGAYLRGALGGQLGSRLSGRDLLTNWGLTAPNDPNAWEWADVAGLAADILVDPLTFLNPFGGLTKAGLVAKGAGVGADDLAKIATQKLGAQAGKIGPRQARMSLTFDDLLNATREMPDQRLANQLQSTLDTMKVNPADLAGQRLGGALGYDIPFTGIGGAVGTGAPAQAVARGLDLTGAAIANSWPGRKASQLFEAAVQGLGTGAGQTAARAATKGSQLLEQDVKRQAQEHLSFLEKELTTQFPDLDAVKRNEILRGVAEFDPERMGDLGDYLQTGGLPLPSQAVIDRVNQMQGMFDQLDNELADLSLPTPKWLSELQQRYFPRRKTEAAFGEKSPAKIGGTKVLDLERESDIARNKKLDVEGGAVAVSRLSVDPKLVGPDALTDAAERTAHVLAANPWMAKELDAPVQSVMSDTGKVYVPHEASARADVPEVLVMVDPQKLDQGWQRGLQEMYVKPGEESVKGRRKNVEQFLKEDKPIQAPRIEVNPQTGQVLFQDGRHRFAVLRDANESAVGVMVPSDQADAVKQMFGAAGYEPQTGAQALSSAVEKRTYGEWKPKTTLDETIGRVALSEEGINPNVLKQYVERDADLHLAQVDQQKAAYVETLKNRLPPHVWKKIYNDSIEDLKGLDEYRFDQLAEEAWNNGLLPSDAPDQTGGLAGALLDLIRDIKSPTKATADGGALAKITAENPDVVKNILSRNYTEIYDESQRLKKLTPDEEKLLKMQGRAAGLADFLKTEHPARAFMSNEKAGVRAGLFDNHLVQDWETGVKQTRHAGLVARSMIDALADAATDAPIPGRTMQLEGHNNVLDMLGFGRDMTDETGAVVKDSSGRVVKDVGGAVDQFRQRLQQLGKNPDSYNIPIEVAKDLQRLQEGMNSAPWLEFFDKITRVTKSYLTFSPAFHGRNLTSGQLQNLFTGAYDAVKHPRQAARALSDSWALSRGKETKYLHTLPIVQRELGKVSEKEARDWLMDLAVRYEAVDPSIAETVGKEFAGIAAANTGRKVVADPDNVGGVAKNELKDRSEYILGRGRRDPLTQTETRRGARTDGYDSNVLTQLIPTPDVNQMFGGPDPLSRYKGQNPLQTAMPLRKTAQELGSEWKRGLSDIGTRLKAGDVRGAATEAIEGPLSPLNVAGVRGEVSRNALQRAHERLSQNVELFNRMGGFIGWLQQGIHPAEAAARVRAAQVDYKALSPFEKSVMRRTVPFYSFNRRMAEFVANELMDKPGGGLSQVIQATNTGRTDDSFVPDYVGEGAAIPLGEGRYITGLGLMHEGPLSMFAIGPSLGDTVHRTAQKLGAQLNPAFKAPIEAATQVNLFTGRPLNELYQYPIEGATSTTAQLANSTLMNSPLSRAITISRKLKDPRKDIPEKALNLLTGINVTTLSGGVERAKEMEARKALEAALRQAPGAQVMENVYIRKEDLEKLSPEQRRAYELRKVMLKRAREAAKKKEREAVR